MNKPNASTRCSAHLAVIIFSHIAVAAARADDWGGYQISPAGAPNMVLEAVGSGTTDGTIVSLGKPADAPNQTWLITPKEGNYCTIKPSYSSSLVLSATRATVGHGTQIVIETDRGQPLQLWTLRKNDNGTYSIIPKQDPETCIDDNGGKHEPGARLDLWKLSPKDQHLQWLIRPLAGTLQPAATTQPADPNAYVPPDIKPEAILKGQTKSVEFTTSKIFPGTVRSITVFIPAQYDGSKPACVFLKTDGYNPREKDLLETLIATKEMPVTIGVFVKPGEVPSPVKGTIGRRNRDLEYDGMGDANVRFFAEEILPFVAKNFDLKLSDSGNDRCIAGGSSGGITAFNAAWERPDLFSRVYCNSGSFVGFRGGHEFPELIRKFEAKPIRAFMTSGTHDMENCAGDWFLLDQEVAKALKFSGYDYSFHIVEGGHGAGHFEFYQEAMAYLWKDWPKPVVAGPSAPRAQDVLVPGETWQLVAKDLHNARGPASNATGEVFFTSPNDSKIYKLDLGDKISDFVADAGKANSLSFGPQGQLYAVSSASGKITSYDPAGKASDVIDGIPGQYILAMPTGGLYVTTASANPDLGGDVWFIKDGKKTLVDSGLKSPAGLAYRPDQWLLQVAESRSKWACSYQINPDGSLTNKERFFWYHVPDGEDDAGPESLCYAKEGQMFAGTRFGIQISADDGPTQVILPLPDKSRAVGVCLGGKDLDTLFAFTGSEVWKRKVKTHAVNAATPWMKAVGTKL